MQDLPTFESQKPPQEAPAPPKKPRQKPTRKRKARKVRAAALVLKKTRRKRRTCGIPAGRKVIAVAGNLNHAEFHAAWNVVASLSKFDNDSKKRILAKASELWT